MTRRISRIRRIAYEFEGQVEHSGMPVEVGYDDGAIELYDAAADGERLKIERSAWTDPFKQPLDAANEQYVQTHGKHVAIDVSNRPPFDGLLGMPVESADDITNGDGRTVGRVLRLGDRCLRMQVRADELEVEVVPREKS